MKQCLICLVIFCSVFSKVWAQSPSAAIDTLLKYEVISVKDRPALEQELKEKSEASYQVKILGGLEFIMMQKQFHVDPHKVGISYSYSIHYQLDKKSQDSINTSLYLLLEKVNKAGLLTEMVYTRTLKSIDSNGYFSAMQMIGGLAEMSFRLESLAPRKLMPVADEWYKNGIVSDSSYVRLKHDITNGKIESSFQLNDYCKLDRVFDLSKYPDNPAIWLQQIHRDIASMLPGLNFTDFSYTTVPDTSYSIQGNRFKMILTCNGRVYKYTSLPFSTFKKGQTEIHPRDIFIEDFYGIFNKVLTDQQSPFRLHSILFTPGKTVADHFRYFALIALTDEQAGIFMKEPCMSYMMVSMDRYDNLLTSARIDSVITGWKRIGLFTHLSSTEISKAIDECEADNLISLNGLLRNFPGVVYSLDSALEHRASLPYADLINHLAQITHGAFSPTEITERVVKNGVKLQYFHKGKIHYYIFPTANGWLDAKFSAFVKSLAEENDLPGNFYGLRFEDDLIYLSKQQHDYATEHKLLDFESVK